VPKLVAHDMMDFLIKHKGEFKGPLKTYKAKGKISTAK